MSVIQEIREHRDTLQKRKTALQKILPDASSSTRERAQVMIHNIDEALRNLNKLEENGVGFAQQAGLLLARNAVEKLEDDAKELSEVAETQIRRAQQAASGQIPDAVTEFANNYLNSSVTRTLVDLSYSQTVPLMTAVSLQVRLGVELEAKLEGRAEVPHFVQLSVDLEGSMYADLGITIGYDLPFGIGELSITGGVRGSLSCSAGINLRLEPKGVDLTGTVNTFVETKFGITLYIELPEWVETVSFGYLDSEYSTSLGTWELFNIRVSGYGAKFNTSNGKFSRLKSGNYSVTPGRDVKRIMRQMDEWFG